MEDQSLSTVFCATKPVADDPSTTDMIAPTLELFDIFIFPALLPFVIMSVSVEADIVTFPPLPPIPFVLLLPLALIESANPEIIMFCIVVFVYALAPSASAESGPPVLALASIAVSPAPDIV